MTARYSRLRTFGVPLPALPRLRAAVVCEDRRRRQSRSNEAGPCASRSSESSDHVPKLLRILSALDVAQGPDDLAIPSFRTHRLKGDLAGHYSVWVNGNWRITFRFIDSDVELVAYQDYH